MRRLIDANALLEKFQFRLPIDDHIAESIDECVKIARKIIEEATTVDAVEVPCRCKECKYWRHYDHLGCTEFVKVCTLAYYMIGENGYCLYGAKMDGGNEDE